MKSSNIEITAALDFYPPIHPSVNPPGAKSTIPSPPFPSALTQPLETPKHPVTSRPNQIQHPQNTHPTTIPPHRPGDPFSWRDNNNEAIKQGPTSAKQSKRRQ
ncbi:hypothetical protein N658DRAFT_495886 [Parathielavia hyrcaniae]|uniref:Uncharacterized protein n=1 Tax=Parathielavia hyrcaniae TaxID=113614 RepID=A0AAN6Q541_9PEZI|nr:hypothetical protein N658DRAFT_495886 [Parathielavia hyrcaniae]